jgi:hypothetical protein
MSFPDANALVWDGAPGHYEVHYATLTDPASGTGVWIRQTLLAPHGGGAGECAVWFAAMTADGRRTARRLSLPLDRLSTTAEPFQLCTGDAVLTDRGMAGAVPGAAWELSWEPRLPPAELVPRALRRAGVARTVLVVPHPDLAISGWVAFDGRRLELDGVKGAQAHVWGSQHAQRWAWAHANDLQTLDGEPVADSFFEGACVFVLRGGREVGPATPLVARVRGEDVRATSPLRVLRTASRFGLTTWHAEAQAGARRLIVEVDAPRASLVGVTYHDPDGTPAYCYNSEVASLRLQVWDRTARGRFGWTLRETLQAPGRAHFEVGQREHVPDVELLVA